MRALHVEELWKGCRHADGPRISGIDSSNERRSQSRFHFMAEASREKIVDRFAFRRPGPNERFRRCANHSAYTHRSERNPFQSAVDTDVARRARITFDDLAAQAGVI